MLLPSLIETHNGPTKSVADCSRLRQVRTSIAPLLARGGSNVVASDFLTIPGWRHLGRNFVVSTKIWRADRWRWERLVRCISCPARLTRRVSLNFNTVMLCRSSREHWGRMCVFRCFESSTDPSKRVLPNQRWSRLYRDRGRSEIRNGHWRLLLLWRRRFLLGIFVDLIVWIHENLLLSTQNASATTARPSPSSFNVVLHSGRKITIVFARRLARLLRGCCRILAEFRRAFHTCPFALRRSFQRRSLAAND